MLKLFSGEQLEHLGTVPLFSEPDGTIALTREELEKEIKLAVPKLASLSELSFRDKVQQDIIIPFQSLKRWADGDALDVVVTGTPSFASPKTVLSKNALGLCDRVRKSCLSRSSCFLRLLHCFVFLIFWIGNSSVGVGVGGGVHFTKTGFNVYGGPLRFARLLRSSCLLR